MPPEETKEEQKVGVEVELGGQKVVVNEQLASALKAELDQRNQQLENFKQETQRQLETFGTTLQQVQPPQTPQEENDFWTAPDKYIEERLKKIEQTFEEKLTKKEQAVQAQLTERELWEKFYSKHPDLKRDKDHFLVNAILQRDNQEIMNLSKSKGVDAAMEELANRTINFMADSLGKKQQEPKEEVVLETQGTKSQFDLPTEQKEEKQPENSLSEIIRQRSQRRRSSRVGKTA